MRLATAMTAPTTAMIVNMPRAIVAGSELARKMIWPTVATIAMIMGTTTSTAVTSCWRAARPRNAPVRRRKTEKVVVKMSPNPMGLGAIWTGAVLMGQA